LNRVLSTRSHPYDRRAGRTTQGASSVLAAVPSVGLFKLAVAVSVCALSDQPPKQATGLPSTTHTSSMWSSNRRSKLARVIGPKRVLARSL
jgi:hypothetical protein